MHWDGVLVSDGHVIVSNDALDRLVPSITFGWNIKPFAVVANNTVARHGLCLLFTKCVDNQDWIGLSLEQDCNDLVGVYGGIEASQVEAVS